MLPGLVSRIHRDHRRLFFVILMAFFAGFIMYLPSKVHLGGWHVSWITGAVYASVVGTCALLVCLFLPSMRFMIEAVAVSRLLLSILCLASPGLGQLLLSDPKITATFIVAGGMLISRLMHGRILKDKGRNWRDKLIPRIERRPAQIHATPLQARFVGWIDNTTPQVA